MKQTAVEWIINELRQLAFSKEQHLGMGDIRLTQGQIDDLEEQAKQMEKEQIKVLEDKIENLEAEIWELGNQL